MYQQERGHPSRDHRDDELFTIYVNNLPDELNENGITQIFKSYGEICSIFTPPNAHWAYVSYKTYKEAEHAIRALNERSPLYLNVAFRKKKVEPKNQNYQPPQENGEPIEHRDYRYAQNGISRDVDRQELFVPPRVLSTLIDPRSNDIPINVRSVYPNDLDHNVYNPFETPGRYADTNAMWSRGCMNIDDEGKRYVTMGRGYTRYHIPEPAYPQIEQHIGRVYEKRRAGFYQYGDDRLQNEIGKCQYCGHLAKLRCAKCDAFYCSRECQVGDWSRHKSECKIIPALVGEFDIPISSYPGPDDEPLAVTRKSRSIVELNALGSLRRPKKVTDMLEKLKNSIVPEAAAARPEIPCDEISPQMKFPRLEERIETSIIAEKVISGSIANAQPRREVISHDETKNRDDNDRVKQNFINDSIKPDMKNFRQNVSSMRSNEQQQRPPSSVKSSNSSIAASRTNYLEQEQELAFSRDPRTRSASNRASSFNGSIIDVPEPEKPEISSTKIPKLPARTISKEKFEKVRVAYVAPDKTFWVTRCEDIPKLDDLMLGLNEKIANFSKIHEPAVGDICAVRYETIWHRARITTTKPMTVMYIDYGNEEPADSNDFRSLKDFTNDTAYAIHLRFTANRATREINADEELSIRMIGIDDNGIIEVTDSAEAAPTKGSSYESEPEVADIESRGIMEIVKKSKIQKSALITDETENVRVIFSLSDGTFWVVKIEDLPRLSIMMNELAEKANNYPKIRDLVVGEIYAFLYGDIWHRAMILTIEPTRILYIDFGTVETPKTKDFRSLKDFTAYPAFAILVRLSANSRLKEVLPEQDLSVRIVKICDDGIVEILENEEKTAVAATKASSEPEVGVKISSSNETSLVEKSSKSLPHINDILKINDEAFVQVYFELGENSYAVCTLNDNFIEQYRMIYETLTEVCQADAPKNDNFVPKIGDFVCGKRDDAWLRGYVTSLGPPLRLALVDEARISPVERVIPMPDEYKKISSFGSIMSLDVAGAKFDVNETGQFRITDIIDDNDGRIIIGVLTSPDYLKNVTFRVKNWKPTAEQKGIGFAELKNNSKVCISAYRSERIMYVRSLDNESLERIQRITQNVAKWAQKAPKLDEPPVIGQLVIAKFADGNYYRAIVTKILDDKIGVSYVDYGNAELTTIDQLRLLSDELKAEKSCTSKIVLKNIKDDVPPSKEVHQYLDLMVGKEEPFVCSFEGIPSKDGVILTTTTGECLNDKVNTYLTPVWQREDPSKNLNCFMMDDLEIASLGDIGEKVSAIPLFATDAPFKYVMAPFDAKLITHVSGIMQESLNKYCESTKDHYIPRADELCLATWEGGWYRGACINRSATPTQALIYFLDFGNEGIVDHTNIRQMTQDFMSPAALGVSCLVKNLGINLVNGKVPENVKRRTDELIRLHEPIDVKIVKKASQDDEIQLAGDYEIELPSVREKLIAEGLVKP